MVAADVSLQLQDWPPSFLTINALATTTIFLPSPKTQSCTLVVHQKLGREWSGVQTTGPASIFNQLSSEQAAQIHSILSDQSRCKTSQQPRPFPFTVGICGEQEIAQVTVAQPILGIKDYWIAKSAVWLFTADWIWCEFFSFPQYLYSSNESQRLVGQR